MIMSLEIKVVCFEIDLVKISLKIYELLFKKDEEEIKKLVDEMVTLWKNFGNDVQIHAEESLESLRNLIIELDTSRSPDQLLLLIKAVIDRAEKMIDI